MDLPPIPAGASPVPLDSPPASRGMMGRKRRDPLEILKAEGFTWTNGYRAPGDTDRLREQGYKPAENSAHLDGDGLDLTHPRLNRQQQTARLNELFANDWDGFSVLDEGDHRHAVFPGWGAAPGTPGTPNAGIPDLPEGSTLIQRGSLAATPPMLPAPAKAPPLAPLVKGTNAGIAFKDELPPEVRSKLKPEQITQWHALARDPNSTPEQLDALMGSFGFDLANEQEIVDARAKGLGVREDFQYRQPSPRDTGTGRGGAIMRAGANALTGNFAGEIQALGRTTRDWLDGNIPAGSSFADQLGRNSDFFEGAYAYDRERYPVATFGTELGVGSLIPFGAAARTPSALAKVGAGYGAVYGAGDGSGGPLDRVPSAIVGAGLGAAGGYGIGKGIDLVSPYVGRGVNALRGRFGRDSVIPPGLGREAAYEAAPLVQDGVQGSPGYRPGTAQGAVATARGPRSPEFAPMPANLNVETRPAAPMTRQQIVESNQMASQLHDAWRSGRVEPDADMLAKLDGAIADQELAFARGEIPDDLKAEAEGTLAFLREVRGSDDVAAMAAEFDTPTLTGPAPRQRDYIRLDDLPPIPEGATLLDDIPLGRTRPMGEQPTPEEMAAIARGIRPEDVTPIPSNTVESLDEFERMGDPRPLLQAPDERAELSMRTLPDGRRRLGPLDLIEDIRSQPWALVDEGGELASLGIGQRRDFAKGEGTLGRIIAKNGDETRSLDDAAQWAWERGYFPHHSERPTVNEFLDLLDDTNRGVHRAYKLDDLEELERFNEAQASRFGIEQAADEGRPLADDIGQPIGRDDLKANEPPAVAYEDLPKVGARVGNIDTSKLDTPHAIERAMKNLEARVGGFDAAKRGRISHAETKALAGELGMTVDSLLQARKGRAFNAEEALAARTILAKSYDELVAMAPKIAFGASDEDMVAFHAAVLRTMAIHEKVTAATAEAGRALQALKIPANSRKMRGHIHEAAVGGAGGRDHLKRVANKILDMQEQGKEPGQITKYAMDSLKPRFWDYINEYHIASMLSGVTTQVVNATSTLLAQLTQPLEFAVGAGIGAARHGAMSLAGRKAVADRVLLSEVGGRWVGMIQGTKDGLKAFAQVMRTGDPLDPLSRIETRRHKVIPNFGPEITIPGLGIKTKALPVGSVVRTPLVMLTAADELFKAMAMRQALVGLAVRRVRLSGARGEEAKRKIAEMVGSPPDDLLEESFDYARYTTFQTPLGPLGRLGSRAKEVAPWLSIQFPFLRTPINLVKYAAERSPLQGIMPRVWDDYRAGGARRDMAIARLAVGTGLTAVAYNYAIEGKITGRGPTNPAIRKTLMETGWRPYSIKVGDTYYSYSRLDPFAMLIASAADLATYNEHLTDKQKERAHVALVGSFMAQMESKTALQGMANLTNVLDNPDRYGETFLANLVGSFIPTLSAHVAGSIDPVMRKTIVSGDFGASIKNKVMSRIPGLSDNLEPMRDVYGREIRDEGSAVMNFLNPFRASRDKNDPISAAILDAGIGMGSVRRTLSDGMGGERELTEKELGQYQELAGRYIREDMAAALADPEWKLLDQDQQRKEIRAIARDARADARWDLFGDPEDWESGAGPDVRPAAPTAPPAVPSNLPPLPPGASLVPQ